MVDTRRVHAEHQVARVAQTALVSRSSDDPRPFVGEATCTVVDPIGREQQDSSFHPSVQEDGSTATSSSPHAHLEHVNAQAALLMASELLRYRPANDSYDAWLGSITELVTTVREAPSTSCSLRPPPSRPRDVAHGAPRSPPLRKDLVEPRRDMRLLDQHGGAPRMPRMRPAATSSARCHQMHV
ncbi:hypothetical protein D1007_31346 [Hordeum vulgare]|nr:hypothetical protein D1007_31346 [Hordeum vulgare]